MSSHTIPFPRRSVRRPLSAILPRNIEPARAIAHALAVCGFPVGERGGVVQTILLGLKMSGAEIVSSDELARLREIAANKDR